MEQGYYTWIAIGNPAYSLAINGLGQNGYGIASPAGYSMAAAFIAEVVLTFIFLLVIFGATSEKAPKGFAGIAIGLSLTLIHLVGIPITGTSVNPARSLGPAIYSGWHSAWTTLAVLGSTNNWWTLSCSCLENSKIKFQRGYVRDLKSRALFYYF